jgi:hypothetical protein
MSSRAKLAARRAALQLALLLAACSAGGLLLLCPDCAARPAEVEPSKEEDKEGEKQKETSEKPRRPHTIWQALADCCRAVRSGPCSNGGSEADNGKRNGKDSNSSGDNGKKSPAAQARTEKKDENG